jgi:nucleoside-diphosphate-sugar epimerase
MMRELTVAVTGPTGTFGFGLMPLLQAEDRVARIVGIARRPFDPAGFGWAKLEYRRGDVRDPAALRDAFAGADVVVHLAFLITGGASADVIRAVNVDGTLNAYRAAAGAGARRFVYASSVAAYGFHPDNPVGMTEEWPVRPAARLFYAQEKAELERLLRAEATRTGTPRAGTAGTEGGPTENAGAKGARAGTTSAHGAGPGANRPAPRPDLYLLRPPLVLGPHAVGAKDLLPGPLAPLGRVLAGRIGRFPVPLPVAVPVIPLQFVHEEDLGRALLQCVLGAGPPGAYNVAADGILTTADVAREFGLIPLPLPARPAQLAARAVASLPFLPPAAQWVEAASHPAIMDTTRAKRDLGWVPRFTALEALRDTLRPRP